MCRDVRASEKPVIIDHVARSETYRGHPIPAQYGFQSYISVPIRRTDGSFFGTLCAVHPEPAKVNTAETRGMFALFADLIGFHLDAQDKLAMSEAALISEREAAELREQFIAVMGHDLRNPLASIDAGAGLLTRMPLDDKQREIVSLIRKSVDRMTGLIDNVLDFARGRLGGGLTLERRSDVQLRPILQHVVSELRSAWPGREIPAQFEIDEPVNCDHQRISQLTSNLLANALIHGAEGRPVQIHAATADGMFELSVANAGEPLSQSARGNLFQPFFRNTMRANSQGLGLGLYIVSEIARAHGGTVDVTSTPEETRFTFRMPVA